MLPQNARRKPPNRSPAKRSAKAMACIVARGLRKAFGTTIALDGIDLRVEEGRILGLIGPNGAGKTTALNAILGLTAYQGELRVLGRNPWTERDQLMRDVCFIADVAVLPRWVRVSQALDYVAGVHPRFDRAKAEGFLAKTTIPRASRVRDLSKGMVTQLHLALVMAIDAKLLVLDEPTLGLDILYRKQFYDALLNDYFDGNRTVLVTTHQVEEIEHVLTDVMFIGRGRIVFDCSMEELESRYLEVAVHPEQVAAARALKPIQERQVFGRSILLFDAVDGRQLAALGEVRRPSVADLFVAMREHEDIEQPYNFAALLLMFTTFLIGVFYCLDALYGERRDRSVLFWKSLPVSDLTIVLSKASIPFVVIPLGTWVITAVTQAIMLLLAGGRLMGTGLSVWFHVSFW